MAGSSYVLPPSSSIPACYLPTQGEVLGSGKGNVGTMDLSPRENHFTCPLLPYFATNGNTFYGYSRWNVNGGFTDQTTDSSEYLYLWTRSVDATSYNSWVCFVPNSNNTTGNGAARSLGMLIVMPFYMDNVVNKDAYKDTYATW